MSLKKSIRMLSAVLLVMAAILVVAPGSCAQSKFQTLHRFTGGSGGSYPRSDLVFDAEGNLYGTTVLGGSANCNCGVVFQLTPNADGSWAEHVIHRFAGVDGTGPSAGLIFDVSGNLYGTTQGGGAYDWGTIFSLSPKSDGRWTETVLYSFTGGSDGNDPSGGLIFDVAGNLFGTTAFGGASAQGTVFELTRNADGAWTESVLYSFCSLTNCRDGENPVARLIFDQAGSLYGTAQTSGGEACSSVCGVVFRLNPNADGSWAESVLYSFCSLTNCRDGSGPSAGLIFDAEGNLYGTTLYGGAHGWGTVFGLSPRAKGSWREKLLHQFTDGKDGAYPIAALIFNATGSLYGTATNGGNPNCYQGCGVVFKLTPNANGGWNETVLHHFLDMPSGEPYAGVVFDAAGTLYGTTYGYQTTSGSVFEITP